MNDFLQIVALLTAATAVAALIFYSLFHHFSHLVGALRNELAEQKSYRLAVLFLVLTFLLALATVGAALYAFLTKGEGFLTGWGVVLVFSGFAATVLIALSFAYDRRLRIRGEASQKKKSLEINSGDKAK